MVERDTVPFTFTVLLYTGDLYAGRNGTKFTTRRAPFDIVNS